MLLQSCVEFLREIPKKAMVKLFEEERLKNILSRPKTKISRRQSRSVQHNRIGSSAKAHEPKIYSTKGFFIFKVPFK